MQWNRGDPALGQATLAVGVEAGGGAPALDVVDFIRERLAAGGGAVQAETNRTLDRLLIEQALEFTAGNHRDAPKTLESWLTPNDSEKQPGDVRGARVTYCGIDVPAMPARMPPAIMTI